MAFAQTLSPQALHQAYRDHQALVSPVTTPPMPHRRQASKQRFVAELSQCLLDFVIQLLPTQEEMAVKEDVRKLLERLIRTIEPDSRLLSFGSTANGFSLRNSDMDLCCLIDSEERLAASDLVTMLGDLLERETKFHVKPLPHARIPIVKLSLDPSPGLPLGIACDIGFENRLALENTRLLMCYAMIDPTRVRTMVLFLKVWSKRRKINSPYKGTLSSYGYVLLVIYFLVHVKNPPVLPNLQQMPPLRPISKEDTHLNGHNIWFFDDIDLLRQRWRSENTETVAELLIDFFRYYSRDFSYNTGVASIRAGLLKKDSKGWQNELTGPRFNDPRERNRLCIEDPFEMDYNVARCVTRDGLYTIRGEFMRASRILAARPERAIIALAELCEERKDEELVTAPPYHSRPPTLPPQTPYTVGNQTLRPKLEERFSPPTQFFEPGPRQVIQQSSSSRSPPEHMAPRRGKWTSPPPPEASLDAHSLFDNQLGMGLQLATSSSEAREREAAYNSSEAGSEVFTDEGSDLADDDIMSVRSYTEGTSPTLLGSLRRPSLHTHEQQLRPQPSFSAIPSIQPSRSSSTARGRFQRPSEKTEGVPPTAFLSPIDLRASPDPSRGPASDFGRRALSGPRHFKAPLSNTSLAVVTALPPSPATSSAAPSAAASPISDPRYPLSAIDPANVYYQTTPATRSPRLPSVLYPTSNSGSSSPSIHHQQPFVSHQTPFSSSPRTLNHSPSLSYLQHHLSALNSSSSPGLNGLTINAPIPRDIFPLSMPPSLSAVNNPRSILFQGVDTPRGSSFGGPDTPTPMNYQHQQQYHSRSLHAHSLSNASQVTATRTPPPTSAHTNLRSCTPDSPRFSQQTSQDPPQPTIPPRLNGSGPRHRNQIHRLSSDATIVPLPPSPVPEAAKWSYESDQVGFLPSPVIPSNTSYAPTPLVSSPQITPRDQLSNATTPSTLDLNKPLSPRSQSSACESSSCGSSPRPLSSIGDGGYSTGISRSPSPQSPLISPPATAIPLRKLMEGAIKERTANMERESGQHATKEVVQEKDDKEAFADLAQRIQPSKAIEIVKPGERNTNTVGSGDAVEMKTNLA